MCDESSWVCSAVRCVVPNVVLCHFEAVILNVKNWCLEFFFVG
uniref:Uncharacterized protein n=1 Tax=Setaria viridis TaxID=4556 RepID=A0A4U6UKW8_SETVI|nr:hypothetical protein SEVIR_5G258766v2 [Setaria viridis]